MHIFRHIFLSNYLMDSKTLPTIWGTYVKLVTKYQISAINSGSEKCTEKWAYMFKVGKQEVGISWVQIPADCTIGDSVQADLIIMLLKINLFSSWYNW
jgi:hypothetical protein